MNARAFDEQIRHLFRREIDCRHAMRARDEKPVLLRIDRGEIPAAVGAGDTVRDGEARRFGERWRGGKEKKPENKDAAHQGSVWVAGSKPIASIKPRLTAPR